MSLVASIESETAGIADAIDELAVRAAYEGEKQLYGVLAAVAALMRQGIASPLRPKGELRH